MERTAVPIPALSILARFFFGSHAAVQLFQEHGIKKVSIADIAARADVSPASIYNFFESKEGLAGEVVRDLFQRSSGEIEAVLNADMSFPEKLRMLMQAKGEAAEYLRGSFVEQIIGRNSELEGEMKRTREKVDIMMAAFFSEGRTQGCISSEISDEALFFYFNIFKAGMAVYETSFRSDPDLLKELMGLFFSAFIQNPGDTESG